MKEYKDKEENFQSLLFMNMAFDLRLGKEDSLTFS